MFRENNFRFVCNQSNQIKYISTNNMNIYENCNMPNILKDNETQEFNIKAGLLDIWIKIKDLKTKQT
jgi:hypothetical protein